MTRFISLLIANFLTGFILLFFLDYLGVTSVYSNIKNKFKPDQYKVDSAIPLNRVEQNIIHKEQFNMAMNSILTREKVLEREREEINRIKSEIDTKEKEIEKREITLNNHIKKIETDLEEKRNYDNKVIKLAENYFSMPPQEAVERLLALEDDLLVIDVLNGIDQYAMDNGIQSTVPFLISLMPAGDSGRLMKKFAMPE